MLKLSFLLFVFLTISFFSFSQKNPSDKAILDSLKKNDELIKLLDEIDKPSSYFKIDVAVGNRLFSIRNNSLNALEDDNKLVITPALSYFNKSGFGISFATFLLNDSGKTSLFQSSLTPSYEYQTGKKIYAAASYTRYFVKDSYSSTPSPIQNDFYANAYLKKPWLQPGIAIGYSSGKYNERVFVDTFARIGNQNVPVKFTDTISTNTKAFSLIGSVQHSFEAYELLSKKDAFSFTPQLMLNAGSDSYTEKHKVTSANAALVNARRKKKTARNNTISANDKFQFQSLGLNLDLNYTFGKFNLEPVLYLDYYLPKTDQKRFTQVFNVDLGFTF